MAKTETELPGGIGGDIERTSELINDGEFGDSRFVEENELPSLVEEIIEDLQITGDKHYSYLQETPSLHWVIDHPLNKRVSVTITDSAGTVIEGQVIVNDGNRVEIMFNIPFWGYANLN